MFVDPLFLGRNPKIISRYKTPILFVYIYIFFDKTFTYCDGEWLFFGYMTIL